MSATFLTTQMHTPAHCTINKQIAYITLVMWWGRVNDPLRMGGVKGNKEKMKMAHDFPLEIVSVLHNNVCKNYFFDFITEGHKKRCR